MVYADCLAQGFTSQGHHVTLCTRTSTEVPQQDEDYGYQVLRNPTFQELSEVARTSDILLQIESSWRDAFPFLLQRVPWFPTIHRGISDARKGVKDRARLGMEKLAFQLGRTIPISEWVKENWKLSGEVIPNPYQDQIFSTLGRGDTFEYHFTFVGRVVESKGVIQFVESLAKLKTLEKDNPIKIAIVGEGPELALMKSLAKTLPPGLELDFLGRQSSRRVAEILASTKTLVFPTMPSWKEASPLTPLEAIACGCHVIAADSGGTSENLVPSSVLYPSGDGDALLAALEHDLSVPYQELCEASKAFLESRKLNHVTAQYLKTFELVLH